MINKREKNKILKIDMRHGTLSDNHPSLAQEHFLEIDR